MANNSLWDDEAQKRQVEQEYLKELVKAYYVARDALFVQAITFCVKYNSF